MGYQHIVVERLERVATITLARTAKRNALNDAMVQELGAALTDVRADDATAVVILTSADASAFCAGGDLDASAAASPELRWRSSESMRRMRWSLITLPQPTIAAVAGPAYGAGAELAIACDLCIAAENARFRFPGTSFGWVTGTQRLPGLVGLARAKELVFTGRVVEAAEAERIGLVIRVLPTDELANAARELARTIAGQVASAVRGAKRLMNETVGEDPWVGFMRENEALRESMLSGPPPEAGRR